MTLKVEEKLKPQQPVDRVLITGRVTVWQGEGKDKKVIIKKVENHWVDGGLKGVISALIGDSLYTGGAGYCFAWVYNHKMYLGSNTTTPTSHGLTALVSPIGPAPGTPPNTISGNDRSNPATGEWKTSAVAVWDRGTISGTVGELALYWKPFRYLTPLWQDNAELPSAMISRLSNADGDFASFSIDISKSLTVQWEIRITFA